MVCGQDGEVGRASGVDGWLEQTRQRATELADWVATSGKAVGTDGLIAFALLACLGAALLVRRRAMVPEPLPVAAVPDATAPEMPRDEAAARAAVVVAALMAGNEVPARTVRLEEQGGHLTRMALALVALGPSAEAALAALGRRDTGPALTVLATTARARATARDPGAAAAFRDLAALALVDDPAAAVAAVRHAAQLAPDRADVWGLLGLAAAEAGDLGEAKSASETVLKLGAGVGDQSLLAGALGILGEIYLIEGALDRAEEYFRIALTYQAGLARPASMVRNYQKLCQLHQMRGDMTGAADLLSRALALEAQVGRRVGVAELESEAGDLARRRGRLPDACRHWARARLLFQEVGAHDKASEIDRLIAAALRESSPPSGPS
jgi:tetratricopeptide (TPR) repeat protein